MEKFLAWLESHGACTEGIEYVKRFGTPQDFWDGCAIASYQSWVLQQLCDSDEIRVRVLLCMHEAVSDCITEKELAAAVASHYKVLLSGLVPVPDYDTTCKGSHNRLLRLFIRNKVFSNWASEYDDLGGDTCVLIRKHFPTFPLNLESEPANG